jgi:hypothetical protein
VPRNIVYPTRTVSHYRSRGQRENASFQKIGEAAYLNIICGASSEECMEGVITGDNEAGKIDEKLASNVEKHQEEIRPNQAQEGVDFGNRGLSLQVVEHGVFGKLYIWQVSRGP